MTYSFKRPFEFAMSAPICSSTQETESVRRFNTEREKATNTAIERVKQARCFCVLHEARATNNALDVRNRMFLIARDL